jgi:hypothetical protein
MALTTEHLQRLQRVGLDHFFFKERADFQVLAQEAFDYATHMVAPTGQPVLVDDVAAPLLLALNLNKKLADFLASKKLTQKYWVAWFADYVLNQLWDVLNP